MGFLVRDIQAVVAKRFGISVDDLKGKKHTQLISLARHVAMYIAYCHTRASLNKIGRYFGGRHHTTVLHANNKIDKLVETDKEIKHRIENIIAVLKEPR